MRTVGGCFNRSTKMPFAKPEPERFLNTFPLIATSYLCVMGDRNTRKSAIVTYTDLLKNQIADPRRFVNLTRKLIAQAAAAVCMTLQHT